MEDKQAIIERLIQLSKEGYDISPFVGAELAAKIEEITDYDSLDAFEIDMDNTMEYLKISQEDIKAQKEEKQKKIDDDLASLKKKMEENNNTNNS